MDFAKHHDCPAQSALFKLSSSDVQLAVAGMDDRTLGQVMKAAGLRPSRRIIERGAPALLAARLRQLSPSEAHNVAVLLVSHVNSRMSEFFENESDSVSEEFENALPVVLASWPISVVHLLITVFGETALVKADEQLAMMAALHRHATIQPDEAVRPKSRYQRSPMDFLSPLERLVAVAVADESRWSLPSETIAAGALALHGLEPARPGSWFVVGLAQRLAGDALEDMVLGSPADDCRAAHDLGLLVAAALRTDVSLAGSVFSNREALRLLVTALPPEWDVQRARVFRSLIEANIVEAVSVVASLESPPLDWRETVTDIVGEAVNAGPKAQKVLATLDQTISTWLDAPRSADAPDLATALSTVRLRRAQLDRLRGDFVSASRMLERAPGSSLEPARRIEREREVILVQLRLRDASELGSYITSAERERTRLAAAQSSVRHLLDWNPMDPLGRALAGLHSLLEGHIDDALSHWQGVAEEMLDSDQRPTAAALAFHRGLAALRTLEPAVQAAGSADVVRSLDLGYRPAPGLLVEVCELLEFHDATDALERVLHAAVDLHPGHAFAQLLSRQAATGHRTLESAAVELSQVPGIPASDRYSLLRAALDGATVRTVPEEVERRLDLLEELVGRAGEGTFDRDWAEVLGTNAMVREILEPTRADLARVNALRRAGALDTAREVCRSLFYRSASGAVRDIDPYDLLDLIVESGATDDEIVDLRRALAKPAQTTHLETESVRILFVGGNENQEKQVPLVNATISKEFHGRVTVDWHIPGWSSNWSEDAAAIERRYDGCDALVIMTFVRTLLGRRIRRTAGEASIPWISCTGHGLASVERAIERAVVVVTAQRTGSL